MREILLHFGDLNLSLFVCYSEWTETFPNDFRDEVMMMHVKDITSYCACLTVVRTMPLFVLTDGQSSLRALLHFRWYGI